MDETGKYRLHHSLAYHSSLVARLQERWLDEQLRALGLTRTTWCILLAVQNEGLTRPSAIANFVGIDRTATSRALRQMEEEGLITRHTAPVDKRMTKVALRARARALVTKGTPLAVENNRRLAQKLTDAERDALIRLLGKILEGEDLALRQL